MNDHRKFDNAAIIKILDEIEYMPITLFRLISYVMRSFPSNNPTQVKETALDTVRRLLESNAVITVVDTTGVKAEVLDMIPEKVMLRLEKDWDLFVNYPASCVEAVFFPKKNLAALDSFYNKPLIYLRDEYFNSSTMD